MVPPPRARECGCTAWRARAAPRQGPASPAGADRAASPRRPCHPARGGLPSTDVAVDPPRSLAASLFGDVLAYDGQGPHRAGGAGDQAAADWVAGRLAAAGFAVERQRVDAAVFEPTVCRLELEGVE